MHKSPKVALLPGLPYMQDFTNSTPCGVHCARAWHLTFTAVFKWMLVKAGSFLQKLLSFQILDIPNASHTQRAKKLAAIVGYICEFVYILITFHCTVLCTYLTLDICCCLQMNATESRRFSAGICIGSGNQVGILFAKFGLFRLYCVPPKQTSLLSISTTKSSQR